MLTTRRTRSSTKRHLREHGSFSLNGKPMPVDIQRYILEFTDPGFAPLKRVNKMFKAFEEKPARIHAVAAIIQERKKSMSIPLIRTVQRLPYVTSTNLIQWAHNEMQLPLDELVCSAAAHGGHIDVLQALRNQESPCPWNGDVCIYAARNGHLEMLQWLRAQDLPEEWQVYLN